MKKIYMAVSLDELEMPLVNVDTLIELAKWAERPVESIKAAISQNQKDLKNKCSYKIIKIYNEKTAE